jgi:hypothetical protein
MYTYARPGEADPTPPWEDVEPEISRSKNRRATNRHVARIAKNICVHMPWEEDRFDRSMDPLFLETGRQRFAEQWEWVQNRVAIARAAPK